MSDTTYWIVFALGVASFLTMEVLGAALTPSLIRSFDRPDEAPALHAWDLRGRLAPLLAATIVVAIIHSGLRTLVALVPAPTWIDLTWLMIWMLVVLGILLLLRLLLDLATPVAVVERCGPVRALKRSWTLTWSGAALLELFATRFPLLAVVVAPKCIAWLVSRLVDSPLSMHQADLLVGPAGLALALPFAIARGALLYHRYRVRVDGIDSARIAKDASPS